MSDQLEDIKKENERLKAKADELTAINAGLEKALKEKTTGPKKVKGDFTAKWKTPAGKEVTRKFGFVAGHAFLWLNGEKVPTEAVIDAANGKKLTDEVLKAHPWLNAEMAAEHLTYMAKVGYGYLEERK